MHFSPPLTRVGQARIGALPAKVQLNLPTDKAANLSVFVVYIENIELSELLHLDRQQALKKRTLGAFLPLTVADFCAFRVGKQSQIDNRFLIR